jgi:uncharacterized membrane protein YuzA (DUF378 family)
MTWDKHIYVTAKFLTLFSCISIALSNVNSNYNMVNLLLIDEESRKYFYIIIGLLAIYLLLHPPNIYKPHLNMEKSNQNVKLLTYNIKASEAENIMWWVADEQVDKNTIYDNSGISSVIEGNAQIVVAIKESDKNKLLHYREIHGGLLGNVKSIYLP